MTRGAENIAVQPFGSNSPTLSYGSHNSLMLRHCHPQDRASRSVCLHQPLPTSLLCAALKPGLKGRRAATWNKGQCGTRLRRIVARMEKIPFTSVEQDKNWRLERPPALEHGGFWLSQMQSCTRTGITAPIRYKGLCANRMKGWETLNTLH